MNWYNIITGTAGLGSAQSQTQGLGTSSTSSGISITNASPPGSITWISSNSGPTVPGASIQWVDISNDTIDKLFQNPRFISHLKKYIFNQELTKIVKGDDK